MSSEEKIIQEIKAADETTLENVVKDWFEKTRTQGMKIGAIYMSAAIYGVIEKHLKKNSKPSLRDYQRCINEITQIVSVQLTKQNEAKQTEAELQKEDNA